LTPIAFARRARRLYSEREAVVDGTLRFTYAQFLGRCDRWSSALQALGVQPRDRIAYIAPNTHAHLEAYYAVPQIGAVRICCAVSARGRHRVYMKECQVNGSAEVSKPCFGYPSSASRAQVA